MGNDTEAPGTGTGAIQDDGVYGEVGTTEAADALTTGSSPGASSSKFVTVADTSSPELTVTVTSLRRLADR